MRILIAHSRYRSDAPSGEDRVVDQESHVLRAAGHDVRLFERFNDSIARLPLPKKVRIPFDAVWNRDTRTELDRVIRNFHPDVVHIHNVFPLLSTSILAACRGQVPAVMTFHNYRPICPSGTLFRSGKLCRDCVDRRIPLPSLAHGCFRGSALATVPVATTAVVQRHTFRELVSAYVFLSHAQMEHFASWQLPPSRCFVKGNLVLQPDRIVSPTFLDSGSPPIVAYVGRLDENKGLLFLKAAWDRFLSSNPDPLLRLVIAGSGPLEPYLRSWAESHRSVQLVGMLDRDKCNSLLAAARAVVVPSECPETFGLVVGEAMAVGTPPIAPAHASFPELIRDRHDGILFPQGDVEQLAGVFDEVRRNPTLFETLGSAAREGYRQRFEPNRNLLELEAIYNFAVAYPVWDTPRDPGERSAADSFVEQPPALPNADKVVGLRLRAEASTEI
jgi:glycosyltransferase involved in cell wall biosynthesis